jgi:hypothetical protein
MRGDDSDGGQVIGIMIRETRDIEKRSQGTRIATTGVKRIGKRVQERNGIESGVVEQDNNGME